MLEGDLENALCVSERECGERENVCNVCQKERERGKGNEERQRDIQFPVWVSRQNHKKLPVVETDKSGKRNLY